MCVAALASCGAERQDANEPSGRYRVEVVDASFPSGQKLAKRSTLAITVRNAESRKVVPNVAVTLRGFSERVKDSDLADPSRPVFSIDGEPKRIGGFDDAKEAAPEGGETAYVDTWALGRLRPGQTKTFRWKVTAVRAGRYDVRYEIAAGLDGKARAIAEGGGRPRGHFAGTIGDKPPATRVGDDGRSIVQGTR